MYHEEPEQQVEEIEIEAIGIEISSQPIELYKVFKIANVVGGGGEAKHIISEGYVAVNGELETRKRRKVYDGDLIEFNQEFYLIICDAPAEDDYEPQHMDDNPMPEVIAEPVAEKTEPSPADPNPAEPAWRDQKNNSKKADKKDKAEAKTAKAKQNQSSGKGRKSIDFF